MCRVLTAGWARLGVERPGYSSWAPIVSSETSTCSGEPAHFLRDTSESKALRANCHRAPLKPHVELPSATVDPFPIVWVFGGCVKPNAWVDESVGGDSVEWRV